MKTSTLFTMALVALSQIADVSAAVNPTKVIRSAPDRRQQQGKQKPSEFPKPNSPTSQGCFSSGGNFTVQKTPDFFSSGSCGDICTAKKFAVMGLHGDQCLCGNFYPPKNTVVKDSNCNYPCPGFPQEACGSLGTPGFWSVWNTGVNINAAYLPDEEDTTKTSSTTSTAAPTTSSTSAPVTTQTNDQSDGSKPDSGGSSGPNTAGIAAGVVVGVVVVAAAIGGFFFWMRRRRNAEIEEDHLRNAAVNAFINGSKPPSSHGSISMTDSRLDPVMAHRRMSDGSIADNQDYSRRILRVTNA